MADYTIQKGDNLWNIAKKNYNLTEGSDIAKAVNKIAKDNNIKDINKIMMGDNLALDDSLFAQKDEVNNKTKEADNTKDKASIIETSSENKGKASEQTEFEPTLFKELDVWVQEHTELMTQAQDTADYEAKVQEANIKNDFDFMEGKDASNEEEYDAQIQKLGAGEVKRYDKDNDSKLSSDEYLQEQIGDLITQNKAFVESGEMTQEEATNQLASAIIMSDTLFGIIDNKLGNKDGSLDSEELGQYYKYVDKFDNDERKADGSININAAADYPKYLTDQVKIDDETASKALDAAAKLLGLEAKDEE